MSTVQGFKASPGRFAHSPAQLASEDWKDVLWRVKNEFTADRITLIAAGASFYLLLALFPALAAFVSMYGFVADPQTIADQIAFLGGVLPSGGLDLIRTQLESLAEQNSAALSFGFVTGLLVALWSANNGIKTLFEALNVAYEEREKRSFVRLTLVSFVFTLGAIVIGILFIVSVGVVPAVLAFVGMSGAQETLVTLLRWPVLLIASSAAISVLYRYGPSREHAKWRWVTWGSGLASLLWLAASVLFSWYLTNFADYNATYGSLGAVIGFMLWTWISVVILLAGAELNAEIEHQTREDSTTGPEMPMGARGATMADTLGRGRDSGYADKPHAFDPSRRLSIHPSEMQADDAGPLSEAHRRKTFGSRAVGAASLALPVVALGVGVGLGLLKRRHATPSEPARRRASRGATAHGGGLRAFLARPEVKARLAEARRTALVNAEAAARAQAEKLRRQRR